MERRAHKHANRFVSRSVFAAIIGLGILSGAIYGVNFKIHAFVPLFSRLSALQVFVIIFLFLSALYFIGVFLVIKGLPEKEESGRLTATIVFFAIIFRLGLVAAEPAVLSSDMYRYIWDGRVQQNGINPYRHPPGADELENLRDDRVFPNINRKDAPTLYPAGAQLFFRICYTLVGDSVIGYKAIMVGFDILALLALTALLRAWGLNLSRIIVYAWNPLVIFEIAYSGHLEGITVFGVAAALYLYATEKKMPAIILLALSAALKLYPALLLAALLNRGHRIKGIAVFSATILLLYLPFIGAGSKIAGFLPVYLTNSSESFNLGLKYLLLRMIAGLDYEVLSLLFGIALMGAGLVVLFKDKADTAVTRHAYILTGLLMVLMPSALHPWYVILMVPFLVFYPNPAWLMFTCAVSLSYLKYTNPQGIMPAWVLVAEYLPLFVLLISGFVLGRYLGRDTTSGPDWRCSKEEV